MFIVLIWYGFVCVCVCNEDHNTFIGKVFTLNTFLPYSNRDTRILVFISLMSFYHTDIVCYHMTCTRAHKGPLMDFKKFSK